eukprot:g2351.t1
MLPWTASSAQVLADLGPAGLEGWVLKEGKINGWKKRWCALHDARLVFFASQPAPSAKASGKAAVKDSLSFAEVREVADEEGVLTIRTAGRNVRFNPIGEPSLKGWLDGLREATAAARDVRGALIMKDYAWEEISGNLAPPGRTDGSGAGSGASGRGWPRPGITNAMSAYEAAVRLQSAFYARRQRRRRQERHREAAVTALAAAARGRRARDEYLRRLRKLRLLQAAVRGFATRQAAARRAVTQERWKCLGLDPAREEVILAGPALKHRGALRAPLKRHLVLTSRPRLIYAKGAAAAAVQCGEVLGSSVLGCEPHPAAAGGRPGSGGGLLGATGFVLQTPGRQFRFSLDVGAAAREEQAQLVAAQAKIDRAGADTAASVRRRSSAARVPGAAAWVRALRRVAQANRSRVLLDGWLRKHAITGSRNRAPKRRHFVLYEGGRLAYAESKTAVTKGDVMLTHDSIVRALDQGGSASGRFTFEVVAPQMGAHNKLVLVAPDAAERTRWLDALERSIAQLRRADSQL